jgi:type IV pilus assembly protein PilV
MGIKGPEFGFTFIEVLIAISILTVGMLAVAQMQIMGIRGNDISGKTTEALNLAQQQVEQLHSMEWNADSEDPDLSDSNPGNNGDLESVTDIDHEKMVGKQRVVWNIANNTPITNTKTIVVTVTWGGNRFKRRVAYIKSMAD